FNPAMSLFVTCDTEEEIHSAFTELSEDGNVLMPLDSYPFSDKFGWVGDKFGVTWQLNLVCKIKSGTFSHCISVLKECGTVPFFCLKENNKGKVNVVRNRMDVSYILEFG